ncbi:MAG: hypothetical protein SFV24_21385 [Gemmatimonadales bacterium]|nr:hypothetical protein [Gemmatimonadales bacterium]
MGVREWNVADVPVAETWSPELEGPPFAIPLGCSGVFLEQVAGGIDGTGFDLNQDAFEIGRVGKEGVTARAVWVGTAGDRHASGMDSLTLTAAERVGMSAEAVAAGAASERDEWFGGSKGGHEQNECCPADHFQ